MTVDADALADLHARCFTKPRPWTNVEFTEFLANKRTIFSGTANAFALGQFVIDEVELLTIAVDPKMRRTGTGRRILLEFETAAIAKGVVTCHLEVAADNIAALQLYLTTGYTESGRRSGYYSDKTGQKTDAILLSKQLIAH